MSGALGRLDCPTAAPYNQDAQCHNPNQALWFDAVPLLVVAAAYLGATALLARFRGQTTRVRGLEPGVLAVFPAVGLAAAVYGIVLAVEREVPPGGIWLTLGLAVARRRCPRSSL